jgi:hypothetical protein
MRPHSTAANAAGADAVAKGAILMTGHTGSGGVVRRNRRGAPDGYLTREHS